jgi:hypothetical protein
VSERRELGSEEVREEKKEEEEDIFNLKLVTQSRCLRATMYEKGRIMYM